MPNKYAGTQTEKNLEAAFAGESQARNKYTYFASKAKKEGYEQIAALFLKTADNEKEHAKLWFKELQLLKARTTSGRICMKALPRPPRRRASRSLPQSSDWSPKLKSTMKNVTAHCSKMSKPLGYLKRARSKFGNAVTAVISSSALKPLIFVRPVIIRKVSLSFTPKTIDKKAICLLSPEISNPVINRQLSYTIAKRFREFKSLTQILRKNLFYTHRTVIKGVPRGCSLNHCYICQAPTGTDREPEAIARQIRPYCFDIGFRLTQTCA